MKTITYILSNLDKALAFEWISESLDKKRFKLQFILLNPGDSALERYFSEHQITFKRVTFRGKKDIFSATVQVFRILQQWRPDAVHCHLLEASLIGLTAAKLAGIKKRIYTRHYSSFHHVYFPKAVGYDKYLNFMATDIVAITQVVYDILTKWEKATKEKVTIIHHGFRLEEFEQIEPSNSLALKEKYTLETKHPVIGVISRYTIWKGIQYIIPAFKELLKKYPNAVLVLANSHGEYAHQIQGLLSELPKDSYREIRFESQLGALYSLFDVFVHVPIDEHSEAFGQVYVEALAAGIPSVFTKSGIANDFVQDGVNSIEVPFMDSKSIEVAIENILTDYALREKLIRNGKALATEKYGLLRMTESLEKLYEK